MTDRNKIYEILYDELFKNQDFTVPSDKLDDFIMKLAATAIVETYAEIIEEYEDTISEFKEIELNAIMEIKLNNEISNEGELQEYFTCVVRGAESPNSEFNELEKRTDLSFVFDSNIRRNFPLKVEAKIIDRNKPHHKVKNYFESGMLKFLDGRYAPFSKEGMMVAYVRDESTIESTLVQFLMDLTDYKDELPIPIDGFKGDLAVSAHERSLSYPKKLKLSSSFSLWHLWVK